MTAGCNPRQPGGNHRTGTCDACTVDGGPVHRDRRIPRRWGGTYDPANCHDLCTDCHSRKNALETYLSHGVDDDRIHAEWYSLAFPGSMPLDAGIYLHVWSGESEREYLYWRLLTLLKVVTYYGASDHAVV